MLQPRLVLLIVLQIMLSLVLVMLPIPATTAVGNPPAEAGRGVPGDRFSWLSGRRFLEGEGGKLKLKGFPTRLCQLQLQIWGEELTATATTTLCLPGKAGEAEMAAVQCQIP